jgi:biopolymer transport protein ExbB/TolQ
MYILNYIPIWVPTTLTAVAVLALILRHLFPYQTIIYWASILVLVFSIYMLGMQRANEYWIEQSKQAEQELAKIQLELELNNKQLDRALSKTKQLLSKQQKTFEDELASIDTTNCEVPEDLVKLLNKAAKP